MKNKLTVLALLMLFVSGMSYAQFTSNPVHTGTLALGSSFVGVAKSGDITFTNSYGSPVTVTPSLPGSPIFTGSVVPFVVAAGGGTANYTATVTPAAEAGYSGIYSFAWTDGGVNSGTITVWVACVGIAVPTFNPDPLAFGNYFAGQTNTLTLTVQNNSAVETITASATYSAPYSAGALSASPIPVSSSATRTVSFAPPSSITVVTGYNTTVTYTVTSSGGASMTFTESLTATGIPLPTLVSPANTLTGVSIQPTFTWNALTAPTSVTLEIATSNTFVGSTLIPIPVATDVHYTLTEAQKLNNNTTYYWRINVVTAYGSASSPTYSLKTRPALTFLPINPVNGTTGVDFNAVQFSFSSGTTSTDLEYLVQYITDPGVALTPAHWVGASSITVADIMTLPVSPATALAANTKYYWRVVGRSVTPTPHEVVSYSSVYNFTTKRGSYKPYLSWPVSGVTVYSNFPTLYWYIGTYDLTGLSFTVEIYNDNAGVVGAPVAGTPFAATDITIDVPGTVTLVSGNTYWWRVNCAYGADVQTSSYGKFKVQGTSGVTVTKPYLSYPVGGVSVYTTTPTLYWYLGAAGDGLYYDVFQKDITGGPATTIPGTATYADLLGPLGFSRIATNVVDLYYENTVALVPNHTYQWLVVSKNGMGTPGATTYLLSSSSTYKIDASLGTGRPIASWPVGMPTISTTSTTLYWYLYGLVGDITNYEIRYAAVAPGTLAGWTGYGTLLTTAPTASETSFEMTGLIAGNYYWAVRGLTTGAPTVWSQGSFKVVASAVAAIHMYCSAPVGGTTVYTQSPTLWFYGTGDQTNVHHYSITYSRASDSTVTGSDAYGQIKTQVNAGTDNFYALSGLVPGATYYWKAMAVNAANAVIATSSVATFVVAPTATASVVPIAGSPINSIELKKTAATLSWFPPVPGKTQLKYDLEYADNAQFSNAKVVKNISEQTYNVTGLTPNKTYYWRVSSTAIGGVTSSYSAPAEFSISSTVVGVESEKAIPTEFSLDQNYPNPFNPTTLISYSIPTNSYVTLKIFDMLGREVKTLVNNQVVAGKYSVQWLGDDNSGNKVATGVYIYRINANNFTSSKKMLLIK